MNYENFGGRFHLDEEGYLLGWLVDTPRRCFLFGVLLGGCQLAPALAPVLAPAPATAEIAFRSYLGRWADSERIGSRIRTECATSVYFIVYVMHYADVTWGNK